MLNTKERWTLELNNPLATFPGHTIKQAKSPFTPVCIVPAGGGTKGGAEQEARTHQIASSPDLLAALLDIIDGAPTDEELSGVALKPGQQIKLSLMIDSAKIRAARAAIAKAGGAL